MLNGRVLAIIDPLPEGGIVGCFLLVRGLVGLLNKPHYVLRKKHNN